MNNNDGNNDDKGFVLQLYMRTEQKVQEYAVLLQERQRLDRKIEHIKSYVERLNSHLRDEGHETVPIKATPQMGSGVGKPGNRSKAFPIRRMQWEGMGINQIVESILNASPGVSFNSREVAAQIYEIESASDSNIVMRNIRSAMQKGVRQGLWARTDRGKISANAPEEQGRLVHA